MHVIRTINVHQALPIAMRFLRRHGVKRSSRNGDVYQMAEPVATVYEHPTERVLLHTWRDANPFFHFYESLWMLAGRNDVAPLTKYVKRMETFSDDGFTFNAAYGWRWRNAHGDQLSQLINKLKSNHDDRRCVLSIWDPEVDLFKKFSGLSELYTGRDAACNLTVTFQIDEHEKLNMVVFCRSNDIIWGCYGANAVHFSFLQEYVARSVGVGVGTYTQISVNWHAYVDIFEKMEANCEEWSWSDPYATQGWKPVPLFESPADQPKWDQDCRRFVTGTGFLPANADRDDFCPFFRDVAWPIVEAHDLYKNGSISGALEAIAQCAADDWRVACIQWLTRRVR